jgi:hypothetical protein
LLGENGSDDVGGVPPVLVAVGAVDRLTAGTVGVLERDVALDVTSASASSLAIVSSSRSVHAATAAVLPQQAGGERLAPSVSTGDYSAVSRS